MDCCCLWLTLSYDLITGVESERDSFEEEFMVSETVPSTIKNMSRRKGILALSHELDACNLEVHKSQYGLRSVTLSSASDN